MPWTVAFNAAGHSILFAGISSGSSKVAVLKFPGKKYSFLVGQEDKSRSAVWNRDLQLGKFSLDANAAKPRFLSGLAVFGCFRLFTAAVWNQG